MLAQVLSAAVEGVESFLVKVEVNLSSGLPSFSVVGLPQGAVREGRERVTAALRNTGTPLPPRRVTVNLAPADVRKEGSAFDLPIAVGVLVGTGAVPAEAVEGTAFVGELGLDGTVRSVRGALALAVGCRRHGVRRLVVPRENAREAAAVGGLEVVGAGSLATLRDQLVGGGVLPGPLPTAGPGRDGEGVGPDLGDVRGQAHAKRALEVAAAGAHNVLMVGPPGAGKTMLARRLPGILPPLPREEALEATAVHSVAGCLPPDAGLLRARPFRAPHHTISDAGLVGGGRIPRPGEVSLAHHGVLFLDELPEFPRNVLEALRQPMEDGEVTVSRARSTVRFPARFVLVAAMNPCPCGYHGHDERCVCEPARVLRYRGRVSGPLLDRIDLHVEVPAVPLEALRTRAPGPRSAEVVRRTAAARALQLERFAPCGDLRANAQMGPPEIRRFCRPSPEVARLVQRALDRLDLSARAYHRILKVARTIADLEGSESILTRHAAEAVQYRGLDRRSEW